MNKNALSLVLINYKYLRYYADVTPGDIPRASLGNMNMQPGQRKMLGKRSGDMIISQILEVCIGGASKTRIVYQANLNFRTVNPYIDLLIKRGLIETALGTRVMYKTTDEGIELMKSFKHHQEEISKLRVAIEGVTENCS